MDFLNIIKGLFTSLKKDEGIEEVFLVRTQYKRKFKFQLEKQLYMSEDEINQIIDIIESYEKKVDLIKKEFDYSDFSIIKQNKFELELKMIEKEMFHIIKERIKLIMREKANKAKKFFD